MSEARDGCCGSKGAGSRELVTTVRVFSTPFALHSAVEAERLSGVAMPGVAGDNGAPREVVPAGHAIEESPDLVEVSGGGIAADEGVPGAEVPVGHGVEQAAGFGQDAALGEQIEQAVGEEETEGAARCCGGGCNATGRGG